MLRSKDVLNGKDIILFDLMEGSDSIEQLREKCRKGTIVCPECDQPVVLKAGVKKINHFAHQSLESCPLSSESANVLQGRQLLYQWLQKQLTSKYPNNHALVLEKIFPCEHLKRPVDCYIELAKNRNFAYWILESGARNFWEIEYFFQGIRLPLNRIFLSNMIRLDKEKETLKLTPTERHSINEEELSLSYLDINSNKYITYGGLKLYHSPQEYQFLYSIENDLSVMGISPLTGNLIHPASEIKLTKFAKQLQAIID